MTEATGCDKAAMEILRSCALGGVEPPANADARVLTVSGDANESRRGGFPLLANVGKKIRLTQYACIDWNGGAEFAGPENGGPKKNKDWKAVLENAGPGKWRIRVHQSWPDDDTVWIKATSRVKKSWRWVEFSCRHQTQESCDSEECAWRRCEYRSSVAAIDQDLRVFA